MFAARTRRTERGVVAVEFALVMIPLVVLLFGAIQYGLYFWAMQGGSDIARTAARDSAVGDLTTVTCADFRAGIRDQINQLASDGTTATITRTFVDAQSPPNGLDPGDQVQISIRFKSTDLHFPFIPFIHDGVVTSTVTSRVDYVDDHHPSETCS